LQIHVRVGSIRLTWSPISVVTRFADDSGVTAAPPRVLVAHDEPEVEPDFGVQPSIPVRRMLSMERQEKRDVVGFFDGSLRRGDPAGPVFVEPAPVYRHLVAEGLDRPLPRQLHDHLVFLPLIETNSFSVPLPFTAYPFFRRAASMSFLISSLISSSLLIAE
jgi:hypothetical protein